MKQDNVRESYLRCFWGFLSRSLGFGMDSQLLPQASGTGAGRKTRNNRGTVEGEAKGDRRSRKNLGSVTSSVGKGERGIAEICDQINSTADELLTCIRK